ncbi:hypothetical protein NEOLEDRAFT_1225311 [Neolentinus lepideus HHB14362 ss-1]|uniref:Uncharacterized protein n=1 Tax=Neolentinus lepideus HHB14362 ss-1 TaxID=1314782 RepID=A0A165PKK6_9AGAM|nr:hypothetical protein NEOLEDRAFT_1225311 [Neolentinus lepideus HHB14362 ss-1]
MPSGSSEESEVVAFTTEQFHRIPRIRDPLNRLEHLWPYLCFYLVLWALCVPLVVASFMARYYWQLPGSFYTIRNIISICTLLEIFARAALTGSRFWSSWACIPEIFVCVCTIVTWALSAILSWNFVGVYAALVGILVLLVRSISQCLRVAFVALNVGIMGQQTSTDNTDVDIDNFAIRKAFRSTHPPKNVEEVLANSLRSGLEGTIRIAQLVLAIIAVEAYKARTILVTLLVLSMMFETVVCFKQYLRTPVLITVMDVLVTIEGVVALIFIRLDIPRSWHGIPIAEIMTIYAGYVILARSVIQLSYFLFKMNRSFKALSSPAICLPEDDQNEPGNSSVAEESGNPV